MWQCGDISLISVISLVSENVVPLTPVKYSTQRPQKGWGEREKVLINKRFSGIEIFCYPLYEGWAVANIKYTRIKCFSGYLTYLFRFIALRASAGLHIRERLKESRPFSGARVYTMRWVFCGAAFSTRNVKKRRKKKARQGRQQDERKKSSNVILYSLLNSTISKYTFRIHRRESAHSTRNSLILLARFKPN